MHLPAQLLFFSIVQLSEQVSFISNIYDWHITEMIVMMLRNIFFIGFLL